ncbi:hypothetical protein FsymDg_1087 [Candidatus Protofrankia datiscae]|uniref:Uncharacterized protein n=1 Tax=Candidatus Protofrankia datiscae TaxID=2716812 RepID=F8AYT2_9ACTN|nr:hypothetical protein FsymDg_1087 [Candidatus Protofrankia datiscae]
MSVVVYAYRTESVPGGKLFWIMLHAGGRGWLVGEKIFGRGRDVDLESFTSVGGQAVSQPLRAVVACASQVRR